MKFLVKENRGVVTFLDAYDWKSLLCPEFGIYVRVVGKLQIEQSELW